MTDTIQYWETTGDEHDTMDSVDDRSSTRVILGDDVLDRQEGKAE